MNKLLAVNTILRELNENPLASLDIQYPTLSIVIPALDAAQIEVLAQGFWFNTRYCVTLQPDETGEVPVPDDTIVFIPECHEITFEGTRFIHANTGAPWTQAVRGTLITNMPFETIPVPVQYAITYLAAFSAYVTDNGSDATSQRLEATFARWAGSVTREHVRARKPSARRSRSVRKYLHYLRT